MPFITYKPYRPGTEAQEIIDKANEILDRYDQQGYSLTLRQLYYQFISIDFFPNTESSYNRLGNIISRGREAGLVDWEHITDRGRQVSMRPHWDDGEDFLQSVAHQFCLDRWQDQTVRCEVWVEKDALSEVATKAAKPFDVPVLANKGYLSASAAWEAAYERFYKSDCDDFVVLHLGDHDPSGIDMTRDIQERLDVFSDPYGDNCTSVRVKRIALNIDQINKYKPPPNPAKQTDSRFKTYQAKYGKKSWELDALEPSVLVKLIQTEIKKLITDWEAYIQLENQESDIREQLTKISI